MQLILLLTVKPQEYMVLILMLRQNNSPSKYYKSRHKVEAKSTVWFILLFRVELRDLKIAIYIHKPEMATAFSVLL